MTKEKRLGRGLEALLGKADGAMGAPPEPRSVGGNGNPPTVEITLIEPNPFQPRKEFAQAELASLAESIAAHGMLQPLIVRRKDGRYQLVAGERRLKAAIRAGWTEVPVYVRTVSDRELAEFAIVENLQRKDLNPLEKAASFQWYLEQYGCTQEELATRLKIDRSTVANLIRLLDLPDSIQQAVRGGLITQGHARALLPIEDAELQSQLCLQIQKEGWSVRSTEDCVRNIQCGDEPGVLRLVDKQGGSRKITQPRSAHLDELEQQFRASLGTKVELRQSSKGRGKLIVHFRGNEEFERVRAVICGTGRTAHVG